MNMSDKNLDIKDIEGIKNEMVVRDKNYHLIQDKKPGQHKAITLWLTGRYKITEVADMTGFHYMTIRNWLVFDEDIKKYVELYQQEEMALIKNKLQSATSNALDRMIQLCDSDCDGIAIQAARDILDRSGLKPVQKVQKEVTHTYEEKIKNIMDGIDIDYEVVDDEDTLE